ncbi:hypothetical protein ACFQI7_24995 [Paenibacillus allorhizosphaerae]|uniref:DUF4870 domain-containing protein n=1 Tax=Paenibacillus allorhizosphaerae TaxID=2849866 RepID=A0ABN7TQQ8_9BACL|nr:hypothetical protein [Paenibacillus allorhizosphaerae]CAG7644887.1 hypothetical protein PAECIP111802_03374 [Paenibacillus allorhizosphaerae]
MYFALFWAGAELYPPLFLLFMPMSIFGIMMSLLKTNQATESGKPLQFYAGFMYLIFSVAMFPASAFLIIFTTGSDYYKNPLVVITLLILPTIAAAIIAARQHAFEGGKQGFARMYRAIMRRPWM